MPSSSSNAGGHGLSNPRRLEAMKSDCGFDLKLLRADGGASVDNLLLQIQADVLGLAVQRPVVRETTALGTAYWQDWPQASGIIWKRSRTFGNWIELLSLK